MANSDPTPLAERYGTRVEALAAALARDDEAGFLAVLDDILNARNPALIGELRDLTERSGPPAERTTKGVQALAAPWKRFRERRIELKEFHELLKRMDAFLPAAHADAELIRRN